MAIGTPRAIPGLVLDPPKAEPAEKRKRKTPAAKAAKASKANQVSPASANTTDAKVVLNIKGPPKTSEAIFKVSKPFTGRRQKTP